MLVIVTMFALLFSLLHATGAPTAVYPFVGFFCGAVILGQMILFRGRQPRAASCIVGAGMMPLLVITTIAVAGGSRLLDDFRTNPGEVFGALLCTVVSCAALGLVVGYVIGTFIAGVFLIVDRRWNAGQVIRSEPIIAEVIHEGVDETQPSRTKSGGSADGDPWSEK
jgi:MFS superfamily sulfate permease-like transporter